MTISIASFSALGRAKKRLDAAVTWAIRSASTPWPAETAAALTRLRAAGKIGEVGVSHYAPSQVSALQAHLDFPLASIQPEFSALAIEPLSTASWTRRCNTA